MAQNDNPALEIGDSAPLLRVKWLKGEPFKKFEKGKIYVIEFWATWCKPCVAAIPHVTSLAAEYNGRVTFLGIDVFESASIRHVKRFVDSMGNRIGYPMAIEDSNFMSSVWIDPGSNGIPATFVLNEAGKIAWIGHPRLGLKEVLSKVVNHTWDINQAMANRKIERRIEELDDSLGFELSRFAENPLDSNDEGRPDSMLLTIKEAVQKEPALKFAPRISGTTIIALLKTDQHQAYLFSKALLASSDNPELHTIYGNIAYVSKKHKLIPELYHLGIQACQMRMEQWPETADYPGLYHQMAAWYWELNDVQKAIDSERKAIRALEQQKNYLAKKMDTFQNQLLLYKRPRLLNNQAL